jgi:hypothetical protein
MRTKGKETTYSSKLSKVNIETHLTPKNGGVNTSEKCAPQNWIIIPNKKGKMEGS